MSTLKEVFVEQVKDAYSAEKQIIEALPKMIEAAANDELRTAFEDHLEETRGQLERVQSILSDLGENPGSKVCKAMEGLIKEGEEGIKEQDAGPARDALLIASAQKVEHYEIALYGTLRTWAETLGLDDASDLLDETLDEEAATDERLTAIAEGGMLEEGVNEEAEASR